MSNLEPVIVGIIQAQPVYYDLPSTMTKALDLIHDAARNGVQLLTFGETWFPGYPAWLDHCPDMGLWDHQPTKDIFAKLHANSMTVPGVEIEQLCKVAKELELVLVLSINEKESGTLYNTLVTIDADGKIKNRHRKLMPTYTERIVWGQGDGTGLKAVDTSVGEVGALICWEHWMPLVRQAMHNSAEQIHIAVWPSVHEMHQVASRHYAFEGRKFVLAAGGILPVSALPSELEKPHDSKSDDLIQSGGSAIIGPDGMYIVEPVYEVETTLIAELDLSRIIKERMTLDVSGHYSRPDVFDFSIK